MRLSGLKPAYQELLTALQSHIPGTYSIVASLSLSFTPPFPVDIDSCSDSPETELCTTQLCCALEGSLIYCACAKLGGSV